MVGLELLKVSSWWLKGKHWWVSRTRGKGGFSEQLTWDICSWGEKSLGGVWVTHLHHQGRENMVVMVTPAVEAG